MTDDELMQAVRQALARGDLPARAPNRLFGGRGTGTRCAVCGTRIESSEVGYEASFAPPEGERAAAFSVHCHSHCLDAWEAELKLRAATITRAASQ